MKIILTNKPVFDTRYSKMDYTRKDEIATLNGKTYKILGLTDKTYGVKKRFCALFSTIFLLTKAVCTFDIKGKNWFTAKEKWAVTWTGKATKLFVMDISATKDPSNNTNLTNNRNNLFNPQHPDGQYNIGCAYYSGLSDGALTQSYPKAFEWLKKAADQGHMLAQFTIGGMYLSGNGVTSSDQEAFVWFEKAADQGHTSSQYNLGCMYDQGIGISLSKEKALNWFKKAAKQGDISSQCAVGNMYLFGEETEESSSKAFKWIKKAADQNDPTALYLLSFMHYEGKGVPKSKELGLEYLHKAAEHGSEEAKIVIQQSHEFKAELNLSSDFDSSNQ